MINIAPENALELLLKGTVTCHTKELLRSRLQEGKPMRVKAGFDPTAPDLHLGHGVLLRKMAQFQQLGHTVIFLIGDFTGLIGDPSGKKTARPSLSKEQILANAETYKSQVYKILDPQKTEFRFNSEWMESLHSEDWIRITSKFTLAQMLERNDFSRRVETGDPVALHELLYPVIQAYDSIALNADIEIGGNDQLFNLMRGRDLQKAMGYNPQVVITTPLLIGLDGKDKMSKSIGNYIGFMEKADDQFGKVMSISDELMWNWWLVLTDHLPKDIENMRQDHPMAVKRALAREIVSQFNGITAARDSEERWIDRFSKRSVNEATEVLIPAKTGMQLLSKLLVENAMANSRKEAETLIRQMAVSINEEKVKDIYATIELQQGSTIRVRVGKRNIQKWIVSTTNQKA
jgi:tyrosyl-tRNA synthetase